MTTQSALASSYRSLSDFEIMTLEVAGCTAEDWTKVLVDSDFDPRSVSQVHFSGEIRLGRFDEAVRLPGGLERPSGVSHAALHNCTVGNNAYIRNVRRHIANYDIAEQVVIEDVGLIAAEGETSFGNGVEVDVLNEGGGRKLAIFDRLSSQLASLMALFRHRKSLQAKLASLSLATYTSTRPSPSRSANARPSPRPGVPAIPARSLASSNVPSPRLRHRESGTPGQHEGPRYSPVPVTSSARASSSCSR